jgi:hypothetical protein
MRDLLARTAAAALAAVLALTGLVLAAPAASAAASVTVSGPAVSVDSPTTVRVSGTGFQSIHGAFGGIYVVFGWVSDPAGGWQPSAGGRTGADYRYAPDSESTENQGFQRFVAFPGSDTAAAANGGLIAADGTWSTDLVIPGARFVAQDRDGAQTEVDCLQVQCGVITVGAHGVVNPSNETFTPVSFGSAPAAGPAAAAGGAAPAAAAPGAVAAERAPASLGVDRATAVQGRAMTFAAQGFEPGEQVVGTLGSGVVSVGPLTAGAHGEIAGVLQLPADLRLGTHVLKLTGAQSGLAPELEVTVTRDPAEASAADLVTATAAATDQGVLLGLTWPELAVAIAAVLLLVVVVVSSVTAARRRRAARRAAATSVASVAPAAVPPAPVPPAAVQGEVPDADRTVTFPPVRVPTASAPAPTTAGGTR